MGTDLTIDPGRITADTQLLGSPTCRRFLSSLWELEGHALRVTPTVALELPGNVRAAEERRWQRIIQLDVEALNRRYEAGTYNAILKAARAAAETWIEDELERPYGLVAVPRTVDTDKKAAELARSMPRVCFRSTNDENERNDRAIVAEAVVHRFTLLASQNLRSIAHQRLNEWLQDRGHTDQPLIVQIQEALPARSRTADALETTCLRAVMGAALPASDRGTGHDIRALTRFIDILKRGHASQCGLWAEDGLKTAGNVAHLIRGTRENLPMHTREAEERRLDTTGKAARKAGYQGR